MPKTCLDCNNPIVGRADKKFCDDQCRNNYNNKLRADESTAVKNINAILFKNRKILEKLNPDGKTKIAKAKLEKAGFNFTYLTHVYDTQKGNTYKFCYDQGYLALDNDWYLLVKREDL